MRSLPFSVFASILLSMMAHAQRVSAAQPSPAESAVLAACASTASNPLPTDIEHVTAPASFPRCDSYALYDKGEFAAARTCAAQERAALLAHAAGSPAPDDETPVGGMIVLAELYANGEGVARNYPAAARLYCEAIRTGEVDTEAGPNATSDAIRTEIAMIGLLSTRSASAPPLAFCPDTMPTEGVPATRYCEAQWEQEHARMHMGGIQGAEDGAQKDADDAETAAAPLLARMTPAQHAAYDKAAAAKQRFIDADVTGNIIYMGPYGSGGLHIPEEHAAFQTLVAAFLQQQAEATSGALQTADHSLNDIYNELHAAAAEADTLPGWPRGDYGITADSLRNEQRAWLAYRDAMAAFGRTINPNRSPATWLLPVTVARTTDLQQVYDIEAASWHKSVVEARAAHAHSIATETAQSASERSRVAAILDHLTLQQQTAWQHVQDAVSAYATAQTAAEPHPQADPTDRQFGALYGELYAIQYNQTHGFAVDPARAAAGYARNDANLNEEYRKDFATACVFQPLPGSDPARHRTPVGLRSEQRAWINLRDAWVAFLQTVYPGEPREALANMVTGSRAFELRMLHQGCERIGQQ